MSNATERAERPNLSAACGAWIDLDGGPAHAHCNGTVALPAPDDVCQCQCHDWPFAD